MAKKAILLFLSVTVYSMLFSQVKEPADYTEAQKLYKEKKYDAALPLFIKSISQLPTANNDDSLELASCYNYIGLCYYMKLDFTKALTNYKISLNLYNTLNSLDNAAVLLTNISLNYKNARENNKPIKTIAFDSTDAEEVYFSVSEINSLTKDSAIITINEGKLDGLFLGAKGNMVSSYAVETKSDREANVFLGSATIIELSDYSAKAVIYFYKKYIGVKIYPKDLLTIKAYPVAGVQRNVFYEMAKLNVLFLDNDRKEIISTKSILFNTNPVLEDVLLKVYTKQITDFYKDIKGYDTLPNFVSIYKNGRFKGYDLIDAFKITETFDLAGFFNFVKSFPGKYMGTEWKINETYATWVLNEALQGEKNRTWLLPVIEKTEFADLDSVINKAGFYIRYDSLYLWSSRVTELQNNNNLDEAEQLCNKLLYIAKKLKDTRAESEFYYSRSFLNDARGNKKQAIDDGRKAYNGDKTSINYMYALASFYGKNENFDSAFVLYEKLLKLLPGNTNVSGNYGWYKIVAGQFDDAIPLCRTAYYGEPGSVAFSVNYGHCFLLKGNIDSARYYYLKMLDNLSVPSDYYDGPKKDFELFFTKGWQRKNVGEIADWLDTEFNEKYYAITEGNVVWGKAKKYYNSDKFKSAINEWHKYISLFDKSKDPPLSFIHNAQNWIGLSYESMNMYDSAIVYYETANQMALQYLVKERNKYTTSDDDLIVNNYKRMFNFYTTTKNETKAQEYKALYDAEVNKVNELFTTPQLHFICVGGNSITDAVSNQANAKLLFDNLGKLSRADSSNKNKLLNGVSLTKDKLLNAIEQVRKNSRPEDIFIFYYSGTTANGIEETFLSFNQKDSINGKISLNELMNSIDLVYAQKKMIIMDKPNPLLLSTIASKYTASVNTSSEVIFVCPGIETPIQKNNCSLFTNELVNTLNELQKKDKFSAKDFIDKASYTIGRGQYYLPVLSFTSGKDFLVFENKTIPNDSLQSSVATRGIKINGSNGNNADVNMAGPQKNYALIFATDNYNEFPKLGNPLFDAKSIADMLREDFDFSTELMENKTLEEIENTLSDYRDKNFGPNDQLFIFFAGHGIYFDKAKMGYLVAKDSKANDPNKKTYLSYSELGTIFLKNINCKRIFLVLDACFAGSFFDQGSVRGTPEEIASDKLILLKNMATNKAFYKGVSSGGKQYVEDGIQGQHSPFARSFISVLSNTALRKNFVTADEIIGELKSNPPGTTAVCEGSFQYSDPQSHFIFELKSPVKGSVKKERLEKNGKVSL
ncbi:MAG: hypothetical protein E6H08_12030 [Bacteroidetes bacterium]|nr:MAG: hypothetical protein E6H08_12030 [Bacteroidota bacterium]